MLSSKTRNEMHWVWW